MKSDKLNLTSTDELQSLHEQVRSVLSSIRPKTAARTSLDFEQDDLPKILARAVRRAWKLYEVVGGATLSEEGARPSLARHLVRLAKEGLTDEGPLVAAGLRHLISFAQSSLSSETSAPKENEHGKTFEDARRSLPHFRVVDAQARFLQEWRIPWGSQFPQHCHRLPIGTEVKPLA
jgi:hypothetical protein